MSVIPNMQPADETVVLFEPLEGGAVEIRFEGFLWGMVKVFGFPLADSALREIRVAHSSPHEGWSVTNVAMFTQAVGKPRDPRRLLVFQDARLKEVRREALAVESVTVREEQDFSYFTPDRQYYYRRLKELPAPPTK
jgi:hypothetical protein